VCIDIGDDDDIYKKRAAGSRDDKDRMILVVIKHSWRKL
jgi:hypothetical protein